MKRLRRRKVLVSLAPMLLLCLFIWGLASSHTRATASPFAAITSRSYIPLVLRGPTATTVVRVERVWATDSDGQTRMGFASGEPIRFWMRATNSGRLPVDADVDFWFQTPGGVDDNMTWRGRLTLPAATTDLYLDRTFPTECCLPYLYVGDSIFNGQVSVTSYTLYGGSSLRLFDDFSNPSSGWPSDDGAYIAFGYVDGEYRVVLKDPEWAQWVAGPGTLAGDVVVETHARRVRDTDDAYGVLFGLADDASRYDVFIVDRDAYYFVGRYSSNMGWQTLIDWTYSQAIATGRDTNHLMLVRRGQHILPYVNGHGLGTVEDDQMPAAGWQGLYAQSSEANADIRFDDFRAYDVVDTSTGAVAPAGGRGQVNAAEVRALPGKTRR